MDEKKTPFKATSYRPARRKKRTAPPAKVEGVKLDPVAEAQKKIESQRLLQYEKELIFDLAGEKSLREELRRLALDTVKILPPPPPYKVSNRSMKASHETALLFLSDWHAYEIVKKSRVQDLNEYNAEIFARRAARVIDTTLSIKRRMEAGKGWLVKKCVVAANGDFVSGTIHDVEKHTDAPNVMAAVYGCAMTFALAIRDLAAEFETVEVFCTSGNHGRLPDHKKMSAKDPTRNWDTFIYLMAELALQDCKNVKFFVPDSYIASYMIGKVHICQFHGHEIKSWNSIPHYGIGRWTRGVQALQSHQLTPIDLFMLSHFHSESSIQASAAQTKINGSLIGGTEFSINSLGACDPPSQKLMFLNDAVGVTSEWSVHANGDGGRSYPVFPWLR